MPASAEGPAQNVPKPVMPAVMKEETQEGAEAAVKYWWSALDYMEKTGDSSYFDNVSDQRCSYCAYSSNSANSFYKTGGWSTGTETTIKSIMSRPSETGHIITLLASFAEGQSYDSDGSTSKHPKIEAANNVPWIVNVEYYRETGHWIVSEASYEGRDGK